MLDCSQPDPLRGNDDLDKPLVTCDEKGEFKYVLAPVNPAAGRHHGQGRTTTRTTPA